MSISGTELLLAIISEREKALYLGGHEHHKFGPFEMTLYWEPHYEGRDHHITTLEPTHSFTVDVGFMRESPRRWRFKTLAEADLKVGEMKEQLPVEVAMIAFNLPRRKDPLK